MNLSKLNYRDLVLVLTLEIKVLCSLFKGNKKYRGLLEELARYDTEHEGLPYQKNLLKSLNMSRTQLMNLMQHLYEDFHDKLFDNPETSYPLYKTEVWFNVRSKEDYWRFHIDNMKYLPKKGEYFTIDFVRGEIGGRNFRIEDIRHELENGTHRIDISLSDYWEYDGEFYPDV